MRHCPTKKKHLTAIADPTEIGRLLTAIDDPNSKSSPKTTPSLTLPARELRKLEWTEINWDAKHIKLPNEKMKMGQPHINPLAEQALALVTGL
ncbi:hypothetical protein ACJJI5_05000 [Microbulbifer sp. EKSA008]|uniref:hypothetical protein n=1 Tax=Microbulbifer sp. EKSA008 TaxID=3243367 RepID=UPI004042A3F6